MIPLRDVAGGVLAGGENSRAGGRKAFFLLEGKPFILHITQALGEVCSSVLISANEVAPYVSLGWPVIPDVHRGKGPLGGLHALLRACAAEYLLVSACDTPFVTSELLSYVAERRVPQGAAVAEFDGRLHPLCAVYHTSLVPLTENLLQGENFSLHALLDRCRVQMVPISPDLPFYHPHLLWNANTPDDVRRLSKMERRTGTK